MVIIKIKVKEISKKGIKVLDKSITGTEKLKDKLVEIKDRTNEITNKDINSSNEYATNHISNVSKEIVNESIYTFNKHGKKSFANTKKNIKKYKTKKKNIKNIKIKVNTTKNTVGKGIKTSKNTINITKNVSKESIKNSKRIIENTKRITKATYKSLKLLIKATIKAIKAIIESTKALLDLLIAGGWVAVVIIVLICIIGLLCNSIFGIFFTNEINDNGIVMTDVIVDISKELSMKIEHEKKDKTFDDVNINSNITNWKEIFTIYSVVNFNNEKDTISLNKDNVNEVKKIFWQFNTVKSYIKDENSKKILYIEIESKDITYMENYYKLDYSSREQVKELLSDEYNSMWQSVIHGSVNEEGWVFPVNDVYVITTYYNESHKAIDIASKYNTNIYSISDGIVISAKGGCIAGNISCNGKAGNNVIIKHNDGQYSSKYMHLNKINVKVGDTVSVGQVIGTMGNTGNVIPVPTESNPLGGTHLHFVIQEVKNNQISEINPNLFYNY